MFLNNKKGQTAIELLIALGGIIILAVIVVTILFASSKSKVTQISDVDSHSVKLIDSTLMPPNINSLNCYLEEDGIRFDVYILSSITKDIQEYCLVLNGELKENCVSSNQTTLSFYSDIFGNGNYSVSLVSKTSQNKISEESISHSCKVDLGNNITSPTVISFPKTVNFNCPIGYSKVPGSASYDTRYGKGGFCVMIWEAKMDYDNDGVGDTNTSCINYFTRNSDLVPFIYTTWDLDRCSVTPGERLIVSTAEGMPVANTSLENARNHCSALGSNYHLITNEEWMTIARNLEQQPNNWTGGSVGSGKIKVGNTGTSVGGYFLGGSQASAIPVVWDGVNYTNYKPLIDFVGVNSSRSKRGQDSSARLVLSTGDEVWDFSGNMLEYVNKTLPGGQLPQTQENHRGRWVEFFQLTSKGVLNAVDLLPSNEGWGYNQGVGQILANWVISGDVLFLRGGGAYYYSSPLAGTQYSEYAGGIYSLLLAHTAHTPSTSFLNYGRGVGFRCVYVPQ